MRYVQRPNLIFGIDESISSVPREYPTAIGWESTDTQEEKIRQLGAWVTVQRGHAVANGLPVIAVNRVGHEPDPSGQTNGIQFWGNSFVAGPQGEILAQANNVDEENMVVELDMTRSENVISRCRRFVG